MRLVTMQIIARSPLTFPTRKPGTQFRSSLPYIPGTAIYGALGMALGPQMTDKEAFAELFRSIRCHNAYPAHAGDAWVRPLPATAIHPKGAEDQEPPIKPIDSLAARVCWERQQPTALIYASTDDEGRPWEAVGTKFYTLSGGQLETRGVTQRTLTRVAINRRRGTAEDQRLYSLLAINEVTDKQPTQFRGSLVILDNAPVDLEAALKEIKHVGGRQTTGLGAIEVSLPEDSEDEDTPERIKERIQALTKRFKAQTQLYTALHGESWDISEDRPIFTVNLLSDAILLEHGWVPTNELSGSMLEEATCSKDKSGNIVYPGIKACLIRAFTTTSIIGGWNVSWQRPKPTDVAVNMGGVFVFQAERSLEPGDYAALARLQLDGIGERRAEGYGQVRICDSFHVPETEGTK